MLQAVEAWPFNFHSCKSIAVMYKYELCDTNSFLDTSSGAVMSKTTLFVLSPRTTLSICLWHTATTFVVGWMNCTLAHFVSYGLVLSPQTQLPDFINSCLYQPQSSSTLISIYSCLHQIKSSSDNPVFINSYFHQLLSSATLVFINPLFTNSCL